MTEVTRYEPFLGRLARTGTWPELARGTYRVILEACETGDWGVATQLIPLTLIEAEELHQVYGAWPGEILEWLHSQSLDDHVVDAEHQRVLAVTSDGLDLPWEESWQRYVALTDDAAEAAGRHDPSTAERVIAARDTWRAAHDQAVDLIYGLLDVGVRLLGEDCLPVMWDHLMSSWYDEHARRLDVATQPWSESARQLSLAIVDGFHGHLAGVDRLGDVELIEEADRVGFRFAPCGSGNRVMRDDTTDGSPRMEAPYLFSVTTEPHDWSFGSAGVCSYCVHCCLLNMTMPIDRLGYPTRVIDPPLWPQARDGGTCTWWVYRDPSLVPDSVYEKVGRRPPNREGGPA